MENFPTPLFKIHFQSKSAFVLGSSLQVKRKTKMAYKSLDSITRSDLKALGISDDVSYKLLRDLQDIIRNHSSATPPERWIEISRRILHPDLPFSFHQMMYYGCYKDYGPDPPAWLPDPYELLFFIRFLDVSLCYLIGGVVMVSFIGRLLL